MSAALDAGDFPAFFKVVHGFDPFPWQTRLLHHLVEHGRWPKVLDLPTGVGKTAAIDIAVFHLALEAAKGPERRAPVRIAFVVDRRLIVDEAHLRAHKIAEALSKPGTDDVLVRVAARLAGLAEKGEPPLVARRLRGGMPLEPDWARTPSQPTVLCSTVDQVGSRLLFRGYGVSRRMAPIHAGLMGADCLFLLDEAHLARPFEETLQAVGGLQAREKPDYVRPPWTHVLLTATPGEDQRGVDEDNGSTRRDAADHPDQPQRQRLFQLDAEDHANGILRTRLDASKPALLIEAEKKESARTNVDPETHTETEATDYDPKAKTTQKAEALRKDALLCRTKCALAHFKTAEVATPALAVVVNRVARARGLYEALKKEFDDTIDLHLVIGPSRPHDRKAIAKALAQLKTGADKARAELKKPVILVATQTLEAGVDLDLDGLITEAASLDALRQRFGRLNRSGDRPSPFAAVVAHKDDVGMKADDPVYGRAAAATWEQLSAWAQDGVVDFGLNALKPHLDDLPPETLTALLSPKSQAPVLMPAYAELWSQTTPIPNCDPDIGLFLHGPRQSPEGVRIVWRADLPQVSFEGDRAEAIAVLSLTPPRSLEALEISLHAVRAWLARDRAGTDVADAPEATPVAEVKDTGSSRRAFRWAGADSERTGVLKSPNALRPGDLIVVAAEGGGCDRFGWAPLSDAPVSDFGDLGQTRSRHWVRVAPGLLAEPRDDDEPGAFQDRAQRLAQALATTLGEHRDAKPGAIRTAVLALTLPDDLKTRLEALLPHRLEAHLAYGDDRDDRPRGVVFIGKPKPEAATPSADPDEAEHRDAKPGAIREAVLALSLPDHLKKDLEALLPDRLEAHLAYGDDRDDRPRGVVFIGKPKPEAATPSADPDEAEHGETSSSEDDRRGSTPGFPLGLDKHLNDVADFAGRFATASGLPPALVADLVLAGRLHDAGKADPRFQARLYDGEAFATDETAVLAKSATYVRGADQRAGLPKAWRHEALSVRIAQAHPAFAEAHDPELVLWLIGTHHGWGRPFFPHQDPRDAVGHPALAAVLGQPVVLGPGAGPQSLAFDHDGLDWPALFQGLKRRYGVWELARLEAILRLADHRASEMRERIAQQAVEPEASDD